jgi:hypothetical protein
MNNLFPSDLLAKIDEQRTLRGFLRVADMLDALGARGNIVLDPFSILISKDVQVGTSNILYPNVILEANNGGSLILGNNNILYPGAKLLADYGKIIIGHYNEFGDGGIQIKANTPDALIEFGSNGRYMNGAEITGKCNFGSGTQIIGAIRVQNCRLEGGDSYKDPDAEIRGGLLKGCGVARNLTVRQGEVINGLGTFEQLQVERQTVYHPKQAGA